MISQAETFARFLDSLPQRDRDQVGAAIARLGTLRRDHLELLLLSKLFPPAEIAEVLLRRAGFDVGTWSRSGTFRP